MGVLVDIVPNHVGVATPAQSAWWWELLRDGPGSLAAQRFDVDWAANDGRILVPSSVTTTLRDDGTIAHLTIQGELLCYHDHRFPIAPGTDGGTPDEVHAAQHYELAGWRRADDELNYRRFFTINTLAAIRVEDPECSPSPTSRSAAGSTRASSTASGSTTPTACATRRVT